MLPCGGVGLASASPSLNVGAGEPLELAAQIFAQLVHLDVVQLGVGLGRLDQRGGERLVGRAQVGLGPARGRERRARRAPAA